MAVEFNGTRTQRISFSSVSAIDNLTIKSVSFWMYADDLQAAVPNVFIDKLSDAGAGWWIGHDAANDFTFVQAFDGDLGAWNLDVLPAEDTWLHYAIAYDSSNVANNPIIYLSGVPVAFSEDSTPSGTVVDDSSAAFNIGGGEGVFNIQTMKGKLQDVRIYNRILSATEVGILANSRCQKVVLGGLVFWCQGIGAAGKQSFDGASLGTTNKLIDVISGAMGTPYGNPIGRGMTIQTIGGNH